MAAMPHRAKLLALAVAGMFMGPASAAPPAPARGQLLYETHCIACHTTQMHWRAQRRVTDWAPLVAQVRRGQGDARLGWSEADVDAVARHLNDTIYRLAAPQVVARAPEAH